jgi:hypothetical protein
MTWPTISIAFAVALAVMTVLWLSGVNGGDFLFLFFWPAIAVAALFSGNPHNINTAVVFVAALIELFAVILLVVLASRLLRWLLRYPTP